MKREHSPFRPTSDPARTIYDAMAEETTKRHERSVTEWIIREREAVWVAARDYAQQHGLRVPTIEQVEVAERRALGHVDYMAKFAYAVSELLKATGEEAPSA